jgi:hypothetical protein
MFNGETGVVKNTRASTVAQLAFNTLLKALYAFSLLIVFVPACATVPDS